MLLHVFFLIVIQHIDRRHHISKSYNSSHLKAYEIHNESLYWNIESEITTNAMGEFEPSPSIIASD